MRSYEELISEIRKEESLRENLMKLRDGIKQLDKLELDSCSKKLKEEKDLFEKLVSHDDPKVRRLSIQIMSLLMWQEELDLMVHTFLQEETLYVRADYLECIEKLDYESRIEDLKERFQELTKLQSKAEEKGHLAKERMKLHELIFKKDGTKRHSFVGLQEVREILLTTKKNFIDVTYNQIVGLPRKRTERGVMVKTMDVDALFNIRTFEELLFYLGEIKVEEPDAIEIAKQLAATGVAQFLKSTHKEKHPMGIRIHLEENMDREKKGQFIRRIGIALMDECGGFIFNVTSGYEAEIRLSKSKSGYHIYVKLFTMKRDRFAYRKEVVATSMKPYFAANLASLAKEYLKENAQILDPFCGVGTLLIERRMLVPAGDTYGIDIYGEAIKGARINSENVGPNIHYIQRDFRDFTHSYKFDEIITDMPTMTKSVGREEIKCCYELLFKKGREILKPGAVMIIYGNEHGFMKQQLRMNKDYQLLREFEIENRLDTHLYIIGFEMK